MRGLAKLDPVSALLFASIYSSFADLSDFEAELRRLQDEPVPGEDQLPLTVPSDLGEKMPSSRAGAPRGREGEFESVRRGHAGQP